MRKTGLYILVLMIVICSVLYVEFCIFDLQQTRKAVADETVVYQTELEDSEVD